MIPANNYFEEMQRVGVNNLPQTLKETHDYVVRATENGGSWDNYHNSEKIKRLIDLHFQKVNEFISASGSKEASKKQNISNSKSQKMDKEESVFKKAFLLLNKFIPNFPEHLKRVGTVGWNRRAAK